MNHVALVIESLQQEAFPLFFHECAWARFSLRGEEIFFISLSNTNTATGINNIQYLVRQHTTVWHHLRVT